MIGKTFSIICALSAWPTALALAQGTPVYVTNFAKTGNIQTNLIKEFPTGIFVASNSFATPFKIVTDAGGKNYNDSGSVTINVSIPAATNVYTLINAYSPGSGAVAKVEFIGSGGADETFTLNGGADVRDFYQGQFANTLNSAYTENAFSITNTRDGGGTGDVNTGLTGNYVIDEQNFALSRPFLTQTLTQIKVFGVGNGTPILLGVTALSYQPGIASLNWSGANLVIQGTNGLAGETYRVLASEYLTVPVGQWPPIATNILSTNGNFTFTLTNVINTLPQEFFVLELQ